MKPALFTNTLLVVFLLLGVCTVSVSAQQNAADSATIAQLEERIEKLENTESKLRSYWQPIGILVVIITGVLAFFGIKNYRNFSDRVQKQMDDKADEIIEKGLAERFGTTSEVLRFAFKKFDLLSKLRAKRLLVVNSTEDKQYREIYRVLNKEGFEHYDFTSADKLNSEAIKGQHLLILNDVVESDFTEDSLGELLKKHGAEIKILYFGPKHLPRYDIDGLSLYFANSYPSLISRIEEILIEY